MITIPLQLRTPKATMPTRGSPDAACLDLYASEPQVLYAKSHAMVKTGIAWEGPASYAALVFSRSGHAKHGVRLQNSVAVIDADYRGEWMCMMANDSNDVYTIEPGDRIAQIMLIAPPAFKFVQVAELAASVRGAGGFGSTGR